MHYHQLMTLFSKEKLALSKMWFITGISVLMIGITFGVYYFFFSGTASSTGGVGIVAHAVSTGVVSTGITATGKVTAAEVLDLNVYKLASRIDAVTIANGAHVEKGQLLFAFDQSDTSVDVQQSALALAEARLGYDEEKLKSNDPNTAIRTLEYDISALKTNIARSEQKLKSVSRDFLNADLTAEPTDARHDVQISKTAPTIGGLYTDAAQGAYLIKVYRSSEDSGYSYTYSGLEQGVAPVYLGVSAPLGRKGLTITFPANVSHISSYDEWVVAVPNTRAATYVENVETYTEDVETLEKSIAADKVSLANKEIELAQAQRGDTSFHRDLSVENAALTIQKAQVDLQKGQRVAEERRIIAPFSGSVEGIENVVVGATPTKTTNDPINFGSLISDEFMVTFSLGAKEVNRVAVGQKVLVTLTSLPERKPLEATITEISSLPDSSAVAQYTVRASIERTEGDTARLRDGMLADVEIMQQEKTDVLRIPLSAVSYKEGKPTVLVFENLTDEQKASIAETGIVRSSDSAVMPTALERDITLGLIGRYWAEVRSGLSAGDYIQITSASSASAATSTVVERRGGFGGGPSRNNTSGQSNGASRN